jgi:hypothetical protein
MGMLESWQCFIQASKKPREAFETFCIKSATSENNLYAHHIVQFYVPSNAVVDEVLVVDATANRRLDVVGKLLDERQYTSMMWTDEYDDLNSEQDWKEKLARILFRDGTPSEQRYIELGSLVLSRLEALKREEEKKNANS